MSMCKKNKKCQTEKYKNGACMPYTPHFFVQISALSSVVVCFSSSIGVELLFFLLFFT